MVNIVTDCYSPVICYYPSYFPTADHDPVSVPVNCWAGEFLEKF